MKTVLKFIGRVIKLAWIIWVTAVCLALTIFVIVAYSTPASTSCPVPQKYVSGIWLSQMAPSAEWQKIKDLALKLGTSNEKYPSQIVKIWHVKGCDFAVGYDKERKIIQFAESDRTRLGIVTYDEETGAFATSYTDSIGTSNQDITREAGIELGNKFLRDLKANGILNEVEC